jgi:dienelactone hydrolase
MSQRQQTDTLYSMLRARSNRRRFLAGTGSALTALVAGCTGGDDGTDDSTPTDGDETDSEDGSDNVSDDGSDDDTDDTNDDTDDGSDDDTDDTDDDTDDEVETAPEALERQVQEYLALQANGSFEAAYRRLADAAAEQVSAAELEQGWGQVVRGSGQFQSVLGTEFQTVENEVAVVTAETAHRLVRNTWRVSLNDSGILDARVRAQEEYAWDPPAYTDRSAFEEETVTLDATDSCDLGGTLSVPTGKGPVPGVVIVHGSGPTDRDRTIGPNKPYKELAWGLASRGVAVLRYDKRTAACDITSSDLDIDDTTTDDALTALERLRARERVADERVFVVGHSLGGQLAPRIANRDGNLAGAVMLAPAARPFADAYLDQSRFLLTQQDIPESERERLLAQARDTAEQIRSLDIGEDEIVEGVGGQPLAGRAFFRTLAEYDGPETAATLGIPLFIAQGGRDYQVTVEDDLALWQESLSGLSRVRFEIYDKLNHLFQRNNDPTTNAEQFDASSVLDVRLVEDIVSFVDDSS